MNNASMDSQINKPQHGLLKRAELPDVNTGAQSINTLREALERKEERIENAVVRGRTTKIKY